MIHEPHYLTFFICRTASGTEIDWIVLLGVIGHVKQLTCQNSSTKYSLGVFTQSRICFDTSCWPIFQKQVKHLIPLETFTLFYFAFIYLFIFKRIPMLGFHSTACSKGRCFKQTKKSSDLNEVQIKNETAVIIMLHSFTFLTFNVLSCNLKTHLKLNIILRFFL